MNDEPLYLIAHKVRGEPAFDIAIKMVCPICEGTNDHCHQCDGVGEWFIIPTSGHRAFPYWDCPLNVAIDWPLMQIHGRGIPDVPLDTIRDHYTTEREAARSLVDMLGLAPKPTAPPPPIKRRF